MRPPIKMTNPDNAWYQVAPNKFVRRDEYNRIMVTTVTIVICAILGIVATVLIIK